MNYLLTSLEYNNAVQLIYEGIIHLAAHHSNNLQAINISEYELGLEHLYLVIDLIDLG